MGIYTGSIDLSNEANTDGNSNQTNDTINGTSGDDIIIAGAATEQSYIVNPSAPPDNQHTGVVQDNDTIIESSGTNTLTGGYDNDTFVFHLNLSSDPTLQTVYYNNDVVPTQVSGANTNGVWNSFVSNLNDWRDAMTALYGADQNTTTESQSYTYGAKNQQSGSVTYDNSFSWYENAVTTNTSTNTITDYGNGHDAIQLDVTQAAFDAAGGTVHYDGVNTLIHIGTFDILVLNANVSESDIAWASV